MRVGVGSSEPWVGSTASPLRRRCSLLFCSLRKYDGASRDSDRPSFRRDPLPGTGFAKHSSTWHTGGVFSYKRLDRIELRVSTRLRSAPGCRDGRQRVVAKRYNRVSGEIGGRGRSVVVMRRRRLDPTPSHVRFQNLVRGNLRDLFLRDLSTSSFRCRVR